MVTEPFLPYVEGYNDVSMSAANRSPCAAAARKLGSYCKRARQVADVAGERTIEWPYSWTDQDLGEAAATAVRDFEDQEQAERERLEARAIGGRARASPSDSKK